MTGYAKALLAQAAALEAAAQALRELATLATQQQVLQPQPPTTPQDHFIGLSRALELAGLPIDTPERAKNSRRRLIGWSRGAGWASRPNGRTVVIHEQRFMAFLRSRCGRAAA
jgi:hypothetical protein